jgi:hypothetical protein
MEVNGRPQALAALARGKNLPYPLNMRLGRPQAGLNVLKDRENSHTCRVLNPGLFSARILITRLLKPSGYCVHYQVSFIQSFIHYSVLRQVHNLFQIEFSTECDLVLPLSVYSFLQVIQYHRVQHSKIVCFSHSAFVCSA